MTFLIGPAGGRLAGRACRPGVVVAHIDAQPTKVVAQVVYLAQQRACEFVAQMWASSAVLVKRRPSNTATFLAKTDRWASGSRRARP
jgi:hypothetical protein